ncbi:MAG TPA: glycine cleavage T C-terminal barrel domain-containing protein, partial [Candidatus Poseidoniales archaeon]|nr:glycine cleavage T C-terminal barrel domain-containing protein [Candidatus Poseidoniales archaeon]
MSSSAPARTACYDLHAAAGATIVDFHGFELPIRYSSITDEHLATRTTAGLFDVAHMGCILLTGPGAIAAFDGMATQNVFSVKEGRCAYTHFCDDDGFIIDDMIFAVTTCDEVVRSGLALPEDKGPCILGVPNASMVAPMEQWFLEHLEGRDDVRLHQLSYSTAILALQGPEAMTILESALGLSVKRFRGTSFISEIIDVRGWVQGTGYTGECGVEIMIQHDDAPKVWSRLIEVGTPRGLKPVGLGARDTLRLEKGYLLSGQDFIWPGLDDIDDGPVPRDVLALRSVQTNVPFGIALDVEFIGRQNNLEVAADASASRLVGFELVARGPPPRPGHTVENSDGQHIGWVTSGAPSPSLGSLGIGLALVSSVHP